ncbi:hypothetical protein ACP70R_025327 [Stipagrostis hirtigluma subsp. patula]
MKLAAPPPSSIPRPPPWSIRHRPRLPRQFLTDSSPPSIGDSSPYFAVMYRCCGDGDGHGAEEGEDEEAAKEADMRKAFNMFDQNDDGFITMDELALGIRQGQGAATLDNCGRMVGQVDHGDDGRVDFSEFKQMMCAAVSTSPSSSR